MSLPPAYALPPTYPPAGPPLSMQPSHLFAPGPIPTPIVSSAPVQAPRPPGPPPAFHAVPQPEYATLQNGSHSLGLAPPLGKVHNDVAAPAPSWAAAPPTPYVPPPTPERGYAPPPSAVIPKAMYHAESYGQPPTPQHHYPAPAGAQTPYGVHEQTAAYPAYTLAPYAATPAYAQGPIPLPAQRPAVGYFPQPVGHPVPAGHEAAYPHGQLPAGSAAVIRSPDEASEQTPTPPPIPTPPSAVYGALPAPKYAEVSGYAHVPGVPSSVTQRVESAVATPPLNHQKAYVPGVGEPAPYVPPAPAHLPSPQSYQSSLYNPYHAPPAPAPAAVIPTLQHSYPQPPPAAAPPPPTAAPPTTVPAWQLAPPPMAPAQPLETVKEAYRGMGVVGKRKERDEEDAPARGHTGANSQRYTPYTHPWQHPDATSQRAWEKEKEDIAYEQAQGYFRPALPRRGSVGSDFVAGGVPTGAPRAGESAVSTPYGAPPAAPVASYMPPAYQYPPPPSVQSQYPPVAPVTSVAPTTAAIPPYTYYQYSPHAPGPAGTYHPAALAPMYAHQHISQAHQPHPHSRTSPSAPPSHIPGGPPSPPNHQEAIPFQQPLTLPPPRRVANREPPRP
ncbi:hypothetical protein HK097_001341 [Rhizophlyctis rosea]|uniref:Uncharacterized protein n=1 Tax=Rhizophlyctis rosea TaxID=64517 RepID=A0AAD5X208_9FUNG|nr:hypothetical protein HK097_001341 [Rhizophlyctis rosea]